MAAQHQNHSVWDGVLFGHSATVSPAPSATIEASRNVHRMIDGRGGGGTGIRGGMRLKSIGIRLSTGPHHDGLMRREKITSNWIFYDPPFYFVSTQRNNRHRVCVVAREAR